MHNRYKVALIVLAIIFFLPQLLWLVLLPIAIAGIMLSFFAYKQFTKLNSHLNNEKRYSSEKNSKNKKNKGKIQDPSVIECEEYHVIKNDEEKK